MKVLLCAAVASAALLPGSDEDAGARFRELQIRYGEDLGRYEAELAQKEEAGEDTTAFREHLHPAHGFVDEFLAAAEEYAGTEDAVQFLYWVVENAPGDGDGLPERAGASLDVLLADHADSASLFRSLRYAAYLSHGNEDRADRVLTAVLGRTQDDDLVFAAALGRAMLRMMGGDTSEAERALCKKDLERAREVAGEERLAEVAAFFFELQHLQIGQIAPDIEGTDLDGVSFRLSDYRGKVVMLDFWGDW